MKERGCYPLWCYSYGIGFGFVVSFWMDRVMFIDVHWYCISVDTLFSLKCDFTGGQFVDNSDVFFSRLSIFYLDCMLLPKPRFESTGGMRIVHGKAYGSLLHLLGVLSVWLKRRSLIILNEASLYVLTSLVLLPVLVYCYSQKCCISDCFCNGFCVVFLSLFYGTGVTSYKVYV